MLISNYRKFTYTNEFISIAFKMFPGDNVMYSAINLEVQES